ncbi:MAG: hypothetical protein QM691_05950 [Opitutaceae bacterium]
MNDPGMLQLLMATEPRKLARLPEAPLDKALAEVQALKDAPPPAPVPPEPIPPAAATGPAAPVEPANPHDEALAALATHVWRAKMRMLDAKTGEPREETRRLYRHIEGAMEAFGALGVRLSDWLDQPYDAGLPVKVLSFQPTPELVRDTVIEAVRPAVFWQDRLLQVGEVIVGIPATPSNQP